jgi:hypothetical protein
MPQAQDIFRSIGMDLYGKASTPKKKKKRVKLTPKQREYIWEHPKLCGRTCSICHQRITKMSDLELDHTRAYSKGGKRLALAHRDCNRMKGSGSLSKIQKSLGIKSSRRKVKKKKRPTKPKQPKGPYYWNPITGKKEPLRF